ncbi:unnamed protein product [Rotaria magnacalcarata]|uniref:Uncharacterized protein n=2 Tax=Rotaria magnacalcarata TaxID=392030 RepID=A0A818WVC5_9BILA|nr:unnamed protein product [Rotaria magnacalcarata]CAF1685144.1 unnamed protein product [Rotaria magnacalcarata]CAF1920235.1 unnamed protein product [Rotaria magnacalcarata]CAF2191659.1 unnamed protein product [Rotaria magnacalcarata]CAF3730869.1 unnamed protein product [Rotaria magnacalcarata]
MCCVTLQQRAINELFHVSPPPFVIPIFRAPTTTSTIKTTINTTITSTNKNFSTVLKQEHKQVDLTSTLPSYMISQHIFENLILTNTIVAAFSIVLMITLTAFLIFLLVPSIRRRWLDDQGKEEKKNENLSTLSRQPSFHQFTLGPSQLNPIFETTTGATRTTTQFGTLFHPHTTTATLLHPTLWTPTSVVSTPVSSQQPQISAAAPTAPPRTKTKATTTTTATAARPPLPSHSHSHPTIQRSTRK